MTYSRFEMDRAFFVRLVISLASGLMTACGAHFTDLRDKSALAAESDGGSDVDVGLAATQDGGEVSDAGAEVIIAQGTWTGRNGDEASGTAMIVRTRSGGLEVRFGADFVAGGTPGSYVVFSARDVIGTHIDTAGGDLILGELMKHNGAQSYPVPQGDDGMRRNVFVFCKAYGIEIARALCTGVQ